MANATQKSLYDPYPVAQSRNFANQPVLGSQDPLLLFNFIKHRIWGYSVQGFDPVDPQGALYQGDFEHLSTLNWMNPPPSNCIDTTIRQTLVLNTIQPIVYWFLGPLRGHRDDYPRTPWGPGEVVDRVGITHLNNQHLQRVLPPGIPQAVTPWQHPGNSQCKMPYRGKWGEKIRLARAQQSVWASYMCGVSGSTSFFLWSYLMSITNEANVANPVQDIHKVFILAAVVLAGDGGHNIREVVYGLTLFFCVFFNFLSVLEAEFQQILQNQDSLMNNLDFILGPPRRDCIAPGDMIQVNGNNRNFNGPIIDQLFQRVMANFTNLGLNCGQNSNPAWLRPGANQRRVEQCTFGLVLRGLRNLAPVVLAGYTETQHLNITGVNEADLNAVINVNGQSPFPQLKDDLVRTMVGLPPTANYFQGLPGSIGYGHELQVFLALENDRYRNENWEYGADNFMERIVTATYPNGGQIMNVLNDRVLAAYRACSGDAEPMEQIPFAFPGSRIQVICQKNV